MTNISLAGTGTIIVLVQALLQVFGIELPEGTVAGALNGLVAFLGFVLLVAGQLRRKDLKFGIVRK